MLRIDYHRKQTALAPPRRIIVKFLIISLSVLFVISSYYVFSRVYYFDVYQSYRRMDDGTFLRLKCGTCALVSNSGHTIGSDLGAKIDENVCVIRINEAPTRQYTDDVGSKTTIRVVASDLMKETVERTENDASEFVLVYDDINSSFEDRNRLELNFSNTYEIVHKKLREIETISTAYTQAIYGNLTTDNATKDRRISITTTFVAFVVAMELCHEKLNIFGVTEPYYCSRHAHPYDAPYNYFPPQDTTTECEVLPVVENHLARRNLLPEEKMVIHVITNGCPHVRFFSPEWSNLSHLYGS